MNDQSDGITGKLSYYGKLIAQYSGNAGQLVFEGGHEATCDFEIGQFQDGGNILICASDNYPPEMLHYEEPVSFRGKTSEGYVVASDLSLFPINFLPDGRVTGSRGPQATKAFSLDKFHIEVPHTGIRKRVHFGLTNLLFDSPDIPVPNGSYILDIPVDGSYGNVAFSVKLLPDYAYKDLAMRTLKAPNVTCELVHTFCCDIDVAQLIEVVTDICSILSVARGSMVSLVYVDEYDYGDNLSVSTHLARITKLYSSWSAIRGLRGQGRSITKDFVEAAYPTFRARCDTWKLNKGTIFSYLDGKVEGDFLEMRGVKLVVALEMLKAVYLELPLANATEFCIDSALFAGIFETLKSAVSKILKDKDIPPVGRENVYSAMRGLNRTSFGTVLKGLFSEIDFRPDKDELKKFIECRDRLVHRGRFYSQVATEEERQRIPAFPRPIDEYAFLVNFLDRIFLRLLGYDGPYIDHSEIGNEKRRETVNPKE